MEPKFESTILINPWRRTPDPVMVPRNMGPRVTPPVIVLTLVGVINAKLGDACVNLFKVLISLLITKCFLLIMLK